MSGKDNVILTIKETEKKGYNSYHYGEVVYNSYGEVVEYSSKSSDREF